jgi:hypothetical protein
MPGYGAPVSYDIAALDTASLQTVTYKVLDQRQVSCSWPSPLRMSRNGRRLVAPNQTLNTVSLISVDNAPPAPCVTGIFSLCLGDGRFEVTATYRTPTGQSGAARAAHSSRAARAIYRRLIAAAFISRAFRWAMAAG